MNNVRIYISRTFVRAPRHCGAQLSEARAICGSLLGKCLKSQLIFSKVSTSRQNERRSPVHDGSIEYATSRHRSAGRPSKPGLGFRVEGLGNTLQVGMVALEGLVSLV